ncbi:MAG: DUF2974 domain-containing protein [Firmicutes bacterium]|nr:DUF2974 domain-containing protein [Bacillota bacterium]
MANIVDYIHWRGDLPVSAMFPWNELDSLVMARFSYLPFERIEMYPGDTIGSITSRILELPKEGYHFREDPKLAEAVHASRRYRDYEVSDFVCRREEIIEEQFSAVTVHLPNREMFLSFRGTDATLVGWKEDFNMAFQAHIPAQIAAKTYLGEIAEKYPHEMIRMGGHSKGGNIAMYAALFAAGTHEKRILEVDSFDGPGFMEEIITENAENPILSRIRLYIPQESVVGRLLEMNVQPFVVQSLESVFHQHNVYNWQVMKDHFLKAQLGEAGDLIDGAIKEWLASSTPEQRQVFVDGVFEVLNASNATTLRELGSGLFRSFPSFVKSYRSISEEDRKTIMQMVQLFAKSYTASIMGRRAEQSQTVKDQKALPEGAVTTPTPLLTDGQ